MNINSQADRIKLDRFTGRLHTSTWDLTTYSVRAQLIDIMDAGVSLLPTPGLDVEVRDEH